MKIIYGMTLSDRAADYIPADDGYRPGAAQDMIYFEVGNELIGDAKAHYIAECLFIATNAPDEALHDKPELIHAMRRLVTSMYDMGMQGAITFAPFGDTEPYCRSMSVGDTVTLEGMGTLACAKQGFTRV